MEFFIGGIIQGSLGGSGIHGQDYRRRVAEVIARRFPGAGVYDPFGEHPQSLSYDDAKGRRVFFELMDRAATVDVLVAFLPEASMGTAIEIWQARHAGAVVVSVSPMADNWVVKFCSDFVVPDLEGLDGCLASEAFNQKLAARRK